MTRDQRPCKYCNPNSQSGRLTLPSYKFGTIICGVGALICNRNAQPIAQDTLLAGAFCCSTAAAAVTASQSVGFVQAAEKLGAGCRIGKDKVVAGTKLVGQCVAGVCKVAYAKVTGSRDVSELAELQDRVGNLIARYAEMDSEAGEDNALVARDAALLAEREPVHILADKGPEAM
jgi:hypothetical protein